MFPTFSPLILIIRLFRVPAWLRWSLVGTTEIEEALEGEHGHHEAPRLERVEDALVERVLFLH